MRRFLVTSTVALLLIGCAPKTGPYAPVTSATRNPLEAQRLTQEAARLKNPASDEAEALLRKALTEDLYHGPAHNNLGVLYLKRGELYEAANEFEWARKLMPGNPDPRINLALTLEQAGRIDEALDEYHAAVELGRGSIYAIQGLARCQIAHGRTDGSTFDRLAEIALRGESKAWREWARRTAATRGPGDSGG